MSLALLTLPYLTIRGRHFTA